MTTSPRPPAVDAPSADRKADAEAAGDRAVAVAKIAVAKNAAHIVTGDGPRA